MHTMMISIKAYAIHDHKNGTYSIEVPAEQLTIEQEKIIDELFPNTGTMVRRLLAQEALFNAFATDAEVNTPRPPLPSSEAKKSARL